MRSLDRDFDGSEAADVDLQEATAKARSDDAATQACELIRDAASETWTIAAGQVRTAWRGSRRGAHLTAAQLEAKQAIRAIRNRKSGEAGPGGPVIAFRGAATARTTLGGTKENKNAVRYLGVTPKHKGVSCIAANPFESGGA